MVVVLDSEYVFKGITQWSEKWRRHGWKTSLGEVDHRDLWEQILWLRGEAGDLLQVQWVPSHLGAKGNEGADVLAEKGREMHPNNLLPLSKRVEEWVQLGLEPMPEVSASEASSDVDSGGSAFAEDSGMDDVSCCDSEETFSTDVSDTRRTPEMLLTVERVTRTVVQASVQMSAPPGKNSVGRGGRAF